MHFARSASTTWWRTIIACVLVWRFVEGLDLAALLGTIKAVEGRPGHPPADPRILLALWLYRNVEAWRARGKWRGFAGAYRLSSGCAAASA